MTASSILRLLAASAMAVASTQPRDGSPGFALEDVTASSGLKFTHHSGATGQKFLPETLGAGAAFVDIDGDGTQDIVLKGGALELRANGSGSYGTILMGNNLTAHSSQTSVTVNINNVKAGADFILRLLCSMTDAWWAGWCG